MDWTGRLVKSSSSMTGPVPVQFWLFSSLRDWTLKPYFSLKRYGYMMGTGMWWVWVCGGYGYVGGMGMWWVWGCGGYGYVVGMGMWWVWVCGGYGYVVGMGMWWVWVCGGYGYV